MIRDVRQGFSRNAKLIGVVIISGRDYYILRSIFFSLLSRNNEEIVVLFNVLHSIKRFHIKPKVKALFNSTVKEIKSESIVLQTPEGIKELKNDFTFILIGFHPDMKHLLSYGVQINPGTLGPMYDEKTFETNVPGLYACGSIVAGKYNNKIFVENGRLHGAVIVAAIRSKL